MQHGEIPAHGTEVGEVRVPVLQIQVQEADGEVQQPDGAIVGMQTGEIQMRAQEVRMVGVRVRGEEREAVGGDKVRLRAQEDGAQERTRVTINGLEEHHHLGLMLLGRVLALILTHGRCVECYCFRILLHVSVYLS